MDILPKESALAKNIQIYFFYGLFLAVLALSVYLFLPFVATLLIAGMASVMLYPIYHRILASLGGRATGLASFVTILLLAIFVFVPLIFLGSRIVKESQFIYQNISANGGEYVARVSHAIGLITHKVAPGYSFDVSAYVVNTARWVAGNFGSIFSSTIHTIFNIAIGLFALFYFLRDGKKFRDTFIKLSPLPDAYDEEIFTRMRKVINGIIKGTFGVAIIQGVVCGVGFFIFGIPHAVLWGAVAAIASLVPGLGTSLVTVPAIVYLFAMGDSSAGIGLAIWALIAVGFIDNVLSPVLMGRGANIHPLFIMFSVFGGVAIFGAPGFLLGPLVVGLLFSLLDIYSQEIEAKKS